MHSCNSKKPLHVGKLIFGNYTAPTNERDRRTLTAKFSVQDTALMLISAHGTLSLYTTP